MNSADNQYRNEPRPAEMDKPRYQLSLKTILVRIGLSLLAIVAGILIIATVIFIESEEVSRKIAGSVLFAIIIPGAIGTVYNLIKAIRILAGRQVTETMKVVLKEEYKLSLPFTFKVTQEHLNQGSRNSATLNPVALALKQAIETDYPYLKIESISVNATTTHIVVEDPEGKPAREIFRNRTRVAVYIESFFKNDYPSAQPGVFELLPGKDMRLISTE